MKYKDYLKNKDKACPFCDLKKEEIIRGNRHAVLTLAQAPYCRDHLIVTCRKHHLRLNLMSAVEKKCVDELIYYGMKKLHKKYKNVTVLYREGNLDEVGKSVEHLHYHLIPEMKIGALGFDGAGRDMISGGRFLRVIRRFRERFIGKK
jgi:diadenosine tetraphosphate (Ap4A) HIT family hydrolase